MTPKRRQVLEALCDGPLKTVDLIERTYLSAGGLCNSLVRSGKDWVRYENEKWEITENGRKALVEGGSQ